MKQIMVEANGLRFACLEAGAGDDQRPLVLMLHGFPDNAWTWEHQFAPLVAAGYRVVAPFLRGYPPTAIPDHPFYDRGTLAGDVHGLILALNGGEPCHLVAQDWGAAMSYGALALYPELVRRAVLMAIPHPAAMAASLADPAQVHRAFHWWYFQLANIPEMTVPLNDYAFVDYLWAEWSPDHDHREHIARVKATLAEPGALAAAIGYYRATLNAAYRDPALEHMREQLGAPITVPTLALCGAGDIRTRPLAAQADHFTGEYAYREVEGCGHFLHREKPAEINALILDWLGRDG